MTILRLYKIFKSEDLQYEKKSQNTDGPNLQFHVGFFNLTVIESDTVREKLYFRFWILIFSWASYMW